MHDQPKEHVVTPPAKPVDRTAEQAGPETVGNPLVRGLAFCAMGTVLLSVSLGPLLFGAGGSPPVGLEVEGAVDVWIDRVESGEIVHEFLLVNRSDRPIRITDVHRSCTCTVAKLPEDRVIAPGERVPVEVVFSPGGRYGRLQETVRFVTDSPATPVVQVSLGGLVPPKPQVSYRPHRLWFPSPDAVRTLYLVVPKLPGYNEPQIWKQTPWIDASVEQIGESEKYTQYAVKVRLDSPPADSQSTVAADRSEGTFGISLGTGAEGFLKIPVVLRQVPLGSDAVPAKLERTQGSPLSK